MVIPSQDGGGREERVQYTFIMTGNRSKPVSVLTRAFSGTEHQNEITEGKQEN